MVKKMLGILIAALLLTVVETVGAATLVPPDDPTQSITYWKPYAIAPEKNQSVARAHAIFSVLLRSWDSTRLEPTLYVVESDSGPWAASLADGNILLSLSAIKTCMQFGKERADDLLAFVLAHELAHQRVDDLWHQKFFRLAGSQAPDVQRKMLKGLKLDSKALSDLERREAQADNDGLIMMATVGFDPFQIVEDKAHDKQDFFTAWVENIWQGTCGAADPTVVSPDACEQAKARALRAQAQLVRVATQSTLFDLGTQAFIAGRNEPARQYFIAYGRDYPSRAVYSSIGLTYLAQALEIYQSLPSNDTGSRPRFFYPLLLDANAQAQRNTPATLTADKRGVVSRNKELKHRMDNYIASAIDYFEKAEKLEPGHRKTHLLMALSYLLAGNTFMARGIVQGKFYPQFGADPAADLIIAMTSAMEGKQKQANAEFDRLLRQLQKQQARQGALPLPLLTYAVYYNFAALKEFIGQADSAKSLWKRLADSAKTDGNALMFRLALEQLRPHTPRSYTNYTAPLVHNMRIGDEILVKNTAEQQSDFWLEGERFQLVRYPDGSRLVAGSDNRIIAAWQQSGIASTVDGVAIGDAADRPFVVFGPPSRQVHMINGDYLAYDALGLAIHINGGKITGWFIYDPVSTGS
jgi:tetratricopeptide (TPR) repeat protein